MPNAYSEMTIYRARKSNLSKMVGNKGEWNREEEKYVTCGHPDSFVRKLISEPQSWDVLTLTHMLAATHPSWPEQVRIQNYTTHTISVTWQAPRRAGTSGALQYVVRWRKVNVEQFWHEVRHYM